MAAEIRSSNSSGKAGSAASRGVRYVTRQPIMDLRGKVHAYELLFSGGPESALPSDRESAVRTVLDNAVIFGLGKLAGGRPAFVKCTAATLAATLVEVLPARMAVLEVCPGVDPAEILTGPCRELKTAGYRIALERFCGERGAEPLMALADYVKVDFSRTDPLERRALRDRFDRPRLKWIAEKVETQEEFARARNEGFDLIEGFYFCRPVLLEGRKVPANRLSQVEILRLLRDDSLDLRKLTELVKRDTSLTYRLLRLVNSPVCAMPQEVYSVQAALLAVGEETFRRMAAVAITSELCTGQSLELLRMSFVRGRFCELASRLSGLDSTEQYLLGLLSLLGVMLRAPMRDLTPMLPLRGEIRRALVGERVRERILLEWLECYERGDWEACNKIAAKHELDREALLNCFEGAVEWADASLHFA